MRVLVLALALLAGSVAGLLADDSELGALQRTHALLQAEYQLAKSPKPYLMVDLPGQRLELRFGGLAVATWTIDAYRCWGRPDTREAAVLVGKSSLDEPEREVQVVTLAPAAEAAPGAARASAELRALELADMPSSYRLTFDKGLQITVRPTPGGWRGRLARVLANPFWYLSRPLISDWYFLRGATYNELALTMPEQDARKLYWASNEGIPCLLRTPEGVVAAQPPLAAGTNP